MSLTFPSSKFSAKDAVSVQSLMPLSIHHALALKANIVFPHIVSTETILFMKLEIVVWRQRCFQSIYLVGLIQDPLVVMNPHRVGFC